MAKITYIENVRWTRNVKKLLDTIIEIVERYDEQGYRMTLRQLYYQLVSQNIIENKETEYGRLSSLLKKARMSGLIDWDFIEDRIRIPIFPNEFTGIDHAMRTIINVYRLERWKDQEYYIEVWSEKDAISGVLEPITNQYHLHLLVNRGYSSASAMHESALRIKNEIENDHKSVILYIGDFDSSGEDMVRDMAQRMLEFGCDVDIRKIALTKQQIKQYNPPPNPVKMSDPRAGKFIANHGHESWEVDSLPPDILVKILRKEIDEMIDMKKYQDMIELEKEDKAKMERFAKRNPSEE